MMKATSLPWSVVGILKKRTSVRLKYKEEEKRNIRGCDGNRETVEGKFYQPIGRKRKDENSNKIETIYCADLGPESPGLKITYPKFFEV